MFLIFMSRPVSPGPRRTPGSWKMILNIYNAIWVWGKHWKKKKKDRTYLGHSLRMSQLASDVVHRKNLAEPTLSMNERAGHLCSPNPWIEGVLRVSSISVGCGKKLRQRQHKSHWGKRTLLCDFWRSTKIRSPWQTWILCPLDPWGMSSSRTTSRQRPRGWSIPAE